MSQDTLYVHIYWTHLDNSPICYWFFISSIILLFNLTFLIRLNNSIFCYFQPLVKLLNYMYVNLMSNFQFLFTIITLDLIIIPIIIYFNFLYFYFLVKFLAMQKEQDLYLIYCWNLIDYFQWGWGQGWDWGWGFAFQVQLPSLLLNLIRVI